MKKPFLSRLVMWLIVAVLVVVVLNQIGLFKPNYQTYPAEIKLLKTEFVTDAIIFRNEALISSSRAGDVTFAVEDGERVPKGTVIAVVTPNSTEDTYQPFQLNKEWLVDMEKIEEEYARAQDQLAYFVKENRLTEVDQVKMLLDQILPIRTAYQKVQGFLAQETAVATSQGQDNKIQIQAPHGGIVAYTMSDDDLLYNPFNIPLLDYNKYRIKQNSQIIRRVLANQPFIRVVQNRETYLVIRVDEPTINQFVVGSRIDVNINGQAIRPVVANIYKHGKEYVVQLRVLEEYTNDYNDRVSTITVTAKKQEGLAIKVSSLIEKEKVTGVYVLKKGYREEFVPVKVLGIFGDDAIIASDNFLIMEGNESKIIPTVNLYDEILEEPKK